MYKFLESRLTVLIRWLTLRAVIPMALQSLELSYRWHRLQLDGNRHD